MKWNKGNTALYIYSDEGYHICIDYLKRATEEDEKSIFRYIVWAPHKNNPEYAKDPYLSHLNAPSSLAMRSNLNEAKKLCEDHYKEVQAKEKDKSENALRLAKALNAENDEDFDDDLAESDDPSYDVQSL